MSVLARKTAFKVVGSNGQISLGKEFAGRQVLVEEHEKGVWLVRTASIIPDNELWLHTPKVKNDLDRALTLAAKTKPAETDLDALTTRLNKNVKTKSTA